MGDFSDTEYVSKSAGILLAHARVHEGLTHRSVATQLGLMVSHVRAIEDNCWETVCDDETSMEYIRSYAALVGLDSDKIADLYRQHASTIGCSARQNDAIIVTVPPATNRRLSHYYWVSVAILLSVGVWAFNDANDGKNAHQPLVGMDEIATTASHTSVEGELKDGIRTIGIGVKQIFAAFKLYTTSVFSKTAAGIETDVEKIAQRKSTNVKARDISGRDTKSEHTSNIVMAAPLGDELIPSGVEPSTNIN